MKKELRYITSLFLLPAVTVTAQQETDFSFPCAEGTVAVRGADFEKVNKKDTSEAHISMTMLFDSLKVRSNRYVAITPILESADSAYRKLFTPVVIAGRRQHIVSERDSALVPQYRGYDFMYLKDAKKEPYAYADVTEYQSWMDGAHLRFYNDECGCCELKDSGMADTPFKTPRNLLELIKFPQLSPVEKLYHLHGSAYVNFVVNKTELRPDYMNNGVELSKIT